ncbi:hypothetical protein B0H16DRAFT_498489 [Mycena metata]|uniref:Uncharacterized protein n=1 Tax=Mycena metata TaxID=1033252 RepID=A0AAD7H932_9AGAR|nr:hypothetical protein B0H16DRAFT_498489 [Mycena metata]
MGSWDGATTNAGTSQAYGAGGGASSLRHTWTIRGKHMKAGTQARGCEACVENDSSRRATSSVRSSRCTGSTPFRYPCVSPPPTTKYKPPLPDAGAITLAASISTSCSRHDAHVLHCDYVPVLSTQLGGPQQATGTERDDRDRGLSCGRVRVRNAAGCERERGRGGEEYFARHPWLLAAAAVASLTARLAAIMVAGWQHRAQARVRVLLRDLIGRRVQTGVCSFARRRCEHSLRRLGDTHCHGAGGEALWIRAVSFRVSGGGFGTKQHKPQAIPFQLPPPPRHLRPSPHPCPSSSRSSSKSSPL